MSKTREALEAAHRYILSGYLDAPFSFDRADLIDQIKAALAAPAQVPVAWLVGAKQWVYFDKTRAEDEAKFSGEIAQPLYTSPQPREWRPIETVPKDGRWVITFDGETVSPNYWLGSEIEHWAKTPLLAMPTHWMPIPQPPKE